MKIVKRLVCVWCGTDLVTVPAFELVAAEGEETRVTIHPAICADCLSKPETCTSLIQRWNDAELTKEKYEKCLREILPLCHKRKGTAKVVKAMIEAALAAR